MNAGILKIGRLIYAHRKGILIGIGIGTGIGAVVDGCRKTYKYAGNIVDEHNEAREDIEARKEAGEISEEAASKEVYHLYFHTGVRFAKTYAFTFGLEAVSIGCFLGAAHAYAKEYSLLYTAFLNKCEEHDKYRQNVRDEFGEEVDFRMANDIVKAERSVEILDPETKKVVSTNFYSVDDDTFTFIFDDTFSDFGDRSYNVMSIAATQDELNKLLVLRKTITIADILERLGAPRDVINGSVLPKLEGFVYDEDWNVLENGPQIVLDISDNPFNPHIPDLKVVIKHHGLIITELYPEDYDFAKTLEDTIKEQRAAVRARAQERFEALENKPRETLDDIFTEIDRKGDKVCQEA